MQTFTAIILAGQRAGSIDPLAEAAHVANKSLVPIAGRPLITHVAEALAATPGLARLRIVAEPGVEMRLRAALPRGGPPTDFVAAAGNLADSVHAGAAGVTGPILITTSDNVLLTPGAAREILTALATADVAVALSTQASVLAAHPDGQRRFYRFADDAYSNCNLYGLAGPGALMAAETFRSGGQFAKKPLRMILALGPIDLALMLSGRLTLRDAFVRISRRLKLRVAPVVLADGAHAIDVDNARTYACAEQLLARRATSEAA
jgi:GTP:adenosylcobinamide-phosphate guanylyltransferase